MDENVEALAAFEVWWLEHTASYRTFPAQYIFAREAFLAAWNCRQTTACAPQAMEIKRLTTLLEKVGAENAQLIARLEESYHPIR